MKSRYTTLRKVCISTLSYARYVVQPKQGTPRYGEWSFSFQKNGIKTTDSMINNTRWNACYILLNTTSSMLRTSKLVLPTSLPTTTAALFAETQGLPTRVLQYYRMACRACKFGEVYKGNLSKSRFKWPDMYRGTFMYEFPLIVVCVSWVTFWVNTNRRRQ